MTRRHPPDEGGALPRSALVGGGFALFAVALEMWGSWGTGATPQPPASWLVPSGWPTAVRVGWWLVATLGVFLANRGLARATGRPRVVATTVTVLLFLGFAVSIALGAEWATWH